MSARIGLHGVRLVIALGVLAVATACSKETPRTESLRAVRTALVAASTGSDLVLAGEVRARHETGLAFRVPGQLLARRVDVGARVRKGDSLARIDARDLQLARSAASAQLAQAQSAARLAQDDLRRFRELREQNFISRAEYERRASLAREARERLAAAEAEEARARNQAGYGVLLAPHDGVVIAVEAEVGQVLAAGQTVLRLARPEEKEIQIAVPEHRLKTIREAGNIEIRLWSSPERVYHGRLRELSPAADRASRTYDARIAVEGEDSALSLGMSAEMRARSREPEQPRIPVSAVFHRDGKPAVWIVDGEPAKVRLVDIRTGALAGNEITVESGIEVGQRIVTAGVQLLREGEVVRLSSDAAVATKTP